MASVITLLLYLMALPLGFVCLYLVLLAGFGLRVRNDRLSLPGPARRFAVLVPAHNEEEVIAQLVQSLKRVDYDPALLKILFVADHCSDGTVRILREHQMRCLENSSGRRGKSVALALGTRALLAEECEWDALCIFDADNIVDPAFFTVAARRLEQGGIVQGNTGIHNKSATVFTRLNHINFVVTNRFKELARSQAGLTCRLRGHGMVLEKSMLAQISLESSSLVEDQDLLVNLVLAGEKVLWEPGAKVESVIPATMQEAKVQRQRWAGGKSVMIRSAVRRLLQRALAQRDPVALDLALDFLMPSNAVLLASIMLLLAVSALVHGLAGITWLYLLLAAGMVLYFATACILEKVPVSYAATCVTAPFLVFWRFWIYLSCLKGARKWR